MSSRNVGAAIVGAVGLAACLIAIQMVMLPAWGVTFDGCTKYMPLDGIKTITRDIWMLWRISLFANLLVLLLFLSRFLRRPRLLVSDPAIATFLCLAIWKALAIAGDVNRASRCGEARDFDYPEIWPWAGTLTIWFAMVVVAVASLAFHRTTPVEGH